MPKNVETIRQFYDALAKNDAAQALGLMADDVQWTSMWQYKVTGPGPQKVAEGILAPLGRDWVNASLVPTEYIEEGDTVVSIGMFSGVNRRTGKNCVARYAHVWTLADGRIARFRQYIDTLAVAEAGV